LTLIETTEVVVWLVGVVVSVEVPVDHTMFECDYTVWIIALMLPMESTVEIRQCFKVRE